MHFLDSLKARSIGRSRPAFADTNENAPEPVPDPDAVETAQQPVSGGTAPRPSAADQLAWLPWVLGVLIVITLFVWILVASRVPDTGVAQAPDAPSDPTSTTASTTSTLPLTTAPPPLAPQDHQDNTLRPQINTRPTAPVYLRTTGGDDLFAVAESKGLKSEQGSTATAQNVSIDPLLGPSTFWISNGSGRVPVFVPSNAVRTGDTGSPFSAGRKVDLIAVVSPVPSNPRQIGIENVPDANAVKDAGGYLLVSTINVRPS